MERENLAGDGKGKGASGSHREATQLLIPVLVASGIVLAFTALAPAEAPAEISVGYLHRSDTPLLPRSQ
jgi:hypothetical protein